MSGYISLYGCYNIRSPAFASRSRGYVLGTINDNIKGNRMVKIIHIVTAILSISGFILRGVWMIRESGLLKNIWVRVLPHVNDTLLLITAVILAVTSGSYPFQQGWLTAKVSALFLYIFLGIMAFRSRSEKKRKVILWIAAILVFFYIVAVARSRNWLVFI